MDWKPTELMDGVAEAARGVLGADPTCWSNLVEAGLLEIDDLLGELTLLIEVGAHGAQLPALETLALGWPARAIGGAGAILTGAPPTLPGPDAAMNTLRCDDALHGALLAVPYAAEAAWICAAVGERVIAFEPRFATLSPGAATDDTPVYDLQVHGAPFTELGGAALRTAWRDRVDLAIAAVHIGLSRKAIELTAAYVGEREQFGRKIGTFQAVSQRIADAWIDLQGSELTLWQAGWRVAEGLPARRELLIARWQAGEAAHRITAAAQHLHGGFGFDRDYPLHRHFLAARRVAFLGGGPNATLEALGDTLAARIQA